MLRYFGSKASSASAVADLAFSDSRKLHVADAFGGIGNIGAVLKARGHFVTTCDVLAVPHAFQYTRIVCQELPHFPKLLDFLNLSCLDQLTTLLNKGDNPSNWFIKEYSKERMFFTFDNAVKISSAWSYIRDWESAGVLAEGERKVLVASLINSMDANANTAGTYYAYLKKWQKKAIKPFEFKWLYPEVGDVSGNSLLGDAVEVLRGKSYDTLYLDPPYNSRDYSRYYHLPETLASLKEEEIDPLSKSGQPLAKSDKGRFIRASMKIDYLLDLIDCVDSGKVVLQYNDGAYIKPEVLIEELNKIGRLSVFKIPVLNYKSINGSRYGYHDVYIIERK